MRQSYIVKIFITVGDLWILYWFDDVLSRNRLLATDGLQSMLPSWRHANQVCWPSTRRRRWTAISSSCFHSTSSSSLYPLSSS